MTPSSSERREERYQRLLLAIRKVLAEAVAAVLDETEDVRVIALDEVPVLLREVEGEESLFGLEAGAQPLEPALELLEAADGQEVFVLRLELLRVAAGQDQVLDQVLKAQVV